MPTRATITFTGRVQGVGFRATTRSIAEGFAITGFVRNEPDGSVLCVAEGEREEVDRFVCAVVQAMGSYVRENRCAHAAATGEFTGFAIRR